MTGIAGAKIILRLLAARWFGDEGDAVKGVTVAAMRDFSAVPSSWHPTGRVSIAATAAQIL